MKGNVINVPTNINQTQLMLPCLPYDEATIGVFLKWRLEYKSFYMFKNLRRNLVMLALKDLISTPLYSNVNVTINLQWNSLFFMHTTLYNQTNDQNISSFDDYDSKNEDHIIYAPIKSMIQSYFLDVSKIDDYEKIIYSIVPSQDFHHLGLFRDNHSKELKFSTLFYGHSWGLNI